MVERSSAPEAVAGATPAYDEIGRLLPSWVIHLDAANRSPRTVRNYTDGVKQFEGFLRERGMPLAVSAITREHVETFLVDVRLRTSASTAAARHKHLKQFFAWLLEDGEITASPLAHVKPPKVVDKPVPVVTDDHLRALFRACEGNGFTQRRDTAILRTMLSGGLRLGEVAGLTLDDLDLHTRAVVVFGKGAKVREVPISVKAVKALDRYLRVRSAHKHADEPWLWLGQKGRLFHAGIKHMIERRCRQAGIPRIHPHQMRHTWAHLWLKQGGGEHDLARLAG